MDQISDFLESMLSPHLAGFGKNHVCQNVLLHMVEKCKFKIVNHGVSGAVLKDLLGIYNTYFSLTDFKEC